MKNTLKFEEVFSSKGRSKILKILAMKEELNISNIVKNTGLNHSSVKNHIKYLQNINFIQEKAFGRIRIYRLKCENLKVKALKNLIEYWES